MNGYSILISLMLRMTVITLCVLLIKTVFKTRLTAKTHTLMWLIVGIQFLFCVGNISIQNSVSIYNVVPDINAVASSVYAVGAKEVIVWIWLAGSGFMALWYITAFVRYRRRIRLYPVSEDAEDKRMLLHIKAILKIPKDERITIRYGDTAQTMPHTVILPEGFSRKEIDQIILHELCHYKHKDYIKLWAGLLILCVNWFNPLIWYAFGVFRTDLEMLCDDYVLNLTDKKKEYAQVLVKSAAVRSRFVPGAASVHNGKSEVAKRVKRIARLKKNKPIWVFICCFICVTACCVCLTDAVTAAVENTIEPITAAPVPTAAPSVPSEKPQTKNQPSAQKQKKQARSEPSADNQPKIHREREPVSTPRVQQNTRPDNLPVQTHKQNDEQRDEPSAENQKDATVPEIGTGREDIYSSMGKPEQKSSSGSREIYQLEDGSKAILQYDGDTLEQGYIVN